jgi:hypothetical protein
MAEQSQLRQFTVMALVLLVPSFALWTALGEVAAMPAIGFSNMLLTSWMPELVHSILSESIYAVVVSQFGEQGGNLVPASGDIGNLAFKINTMALSYSLPFYTALHFATPKKSYLGSYFIGMVILYLALFSGIVCVSLKELMLNLGTVFRAQDIALLPPNAVIAILYQLSSLIIPTLVPALIWAFQSRDTDMMQNLLPQSMRTEIESPPPEPAVSHKLSGSVKR